MPKQSMIILTLTLVTSLLFYTGNISYAQDVGQIPKDRLTCQTDEDCTAGVVCCECWAAINKAYVDELVAIRKQCDLGCNKSCRPQNQPAAVCKANQCELDYTLPPNDLSPEQWEQQYGIIAAVALPEAKSLHVEIVGFGAMYGDGMVVERFPLSIKTDLSSLKSVGDLSFNSVGMAVFTKYPYPELNYDLQTSSPLIELCGYTPQYQCQKSRIQGNSGSQNMPFRFLRSPVIKEAEKIMLSLAKGAVTKEEAAAKLNELDLPELVPFIDLIGKPYVGMVQPVFDFTVSGNLNGEKIVIQGSMGIDIGKFVDWTKY